MRHLGGVEQAGLGLAVDLAGPLGVGTVELRRSAGRRQPILAQRTWRSKTVPGKANPVNAATRDDILASLPGDHVLSETDFPATRSRD